MFSNQKVSPGKSEVRIAFSLDSTSGKHTYKTMDAHCHVLTHTHTHLHSNTFILKTIQTTYLSRSIAFSAPLAEPPLNSHCISTMSVYTCEILPTKTACAQSVPSDTHARTQAHARPHTMALTMLILLHFSCDRCSVYFCRTTALKKTKKEKQKNPCACRCCAVCVKAAYVRRQKSFAKPLRSLESAF